MATTGSWVYQIAKERQEGWRREQWEHPETYRGPDATRDRAPMAASAPDTGRRGHGLSFHGLLHRLNASSRA